MAMQTWSYYVLRSEEVLPTAALDQEGLQGWELVSVARSAPGRGGEWVYTFKRPAAVITVNPV